jgi:hypothetical protein
MPLDLGIWRIDGGLKPVGLGGVDVEARLEQILHRDISILSPNWMIIGRQVRTAHGKLVDLLCLDRDGNLIVVELKRDMTEREIVAQVLDYGSWVRELRVEEITGIFEEHRKKYWPNDPSVPIDEAFCKRFGVDEMPEELNESHELVIVGATFDPATERIVDYLTTDFEVQINAVFFRVFKDGDREYLVRAWLRDPTQTEVLEKPSAHHDAGKWNGEYYVSFGHGETRDWNDAVKYGFVSGGGDPWFSRTLRMLDKDSRIWVNVPAKGYVGVGIVTEPAVKVDQFTVSGTNGQQIPILNGQLESSRLGRHAEDVDRAEYLVRVNWIKTVPLDQAVKEKGLFGNQNTVARPRTPRWEYTIQRLRERFGVS